MRRGGEPKSVIDSKRRRLKCRFPAVFGAAGKRKYLALRKLANGGS
jgi:hypothetical protein